MVSPRVTTVVGNVFPAQQTSVCSRGIKAVATDIVGVERLADELPIEDLFQHLARLGNVPTKESVHVFESPTQFIGNVVCFQ